MNNKHFDFQETEVTSFVCSQSCRRIFVKRDDRFSGGMGGSKARMLKYILYPIWKSGGQMVLTAGGPCSNFNRALAVYCAELGIKLRIISYTENKEQYKYSYNHLICKLMGAEHVYCEKSDVREMIEKESASLKEMGERYEFIYGGAEGNVSGMMAYYEAALYLKEQVGDFDHIFIPCGTGTTASGICAAMQKCMPGVKIHAISVARKREIELKCIQNNLDALSCDMNDNYTLDNLDFHDEYLNGGYGISSKLLDEVISSVAKDSGMILDPVYSGKAYLGMLDILKNVDKDEKVMFWNTGGLINHLSMISNATGSGYGYSNN